MQKLLAAYPTIYIWLDNDKAGIRAQNKYTGKYPTIIPIVVDDTMYQEKDPTDMYLIEPDKLKVLTYLKSLIHEQ